MKSVLINRTRFKSGCIKIQIRKGGRYQKQTIQHTHTHGLGGERKELWIMYHYTSPIPRSCLSQVCKQTSSLGRILFLLWFFQRKISPKICLKFLHKMVIIFQKSNGTNVSYFKFCVKIWGVRQKTLRTHGTYLSTVPTTKEVLRRWVPGEFCLRFLQLYVLPSGLLSKVCGLTGDCRRGRHEVPLC